MKRFIKSGKEFPEGDSDDIWVQEKKRWIRKIRSEFPEYYNSDLVNMRGLQIKNLYYQLKDSEVGEPDSLNDSYTLEYDDVKQELEQESFDGIDSLYEGTEAGEYINSLCYPVEEELNLFVEPSVQAGRGGVWIYDNSTDDVLVKNYDYEDFNYECIELALDSSSPEDFKAKYKQYLETMVKSSS